MNFDHVEKIAAAVLYEGYILYPYRPSSVKNQQRFNFGALYPESYSLAGGGTDAWTMQTECLIKGTESTTLELKIRFLHLLMREVGVPNADCRMRIADWKGGEAQAPISGNDVRIVPSLEVGDRIFQTWQEAVDRDISPASFNLSELVTQPQRIMFTFPAKEEIEPLRGPNDEVVGVLVRKQQAIEGAIELRIADCGLRIDETEKRLFKVTIRIMNLTPFDDADLIRNSQSAIRNRQSRDEALMHTLASTHTILGVRDGEFVSLLDTPEEFREAAASCRNTGTWPVLVGAEGERSMMLSSPIILYDYPQIAPESAGDLFDGTEIDEILTLRIMTLTDDEKREMRGADERARQMLERTETLPAEQLMKLHGAMRALRPMKEEEL
jgi:hydrogenase maturation protease